MKAVGVLVLICIAALSSTARADGICETIERKYGGLKTCYMSSTVIDSKNFLITSDRDESVEGFYAWENKQFEFLPNNFGTKFPNLLRLVASWCSLKEVSKDNFKGLSKLQELILNFDQIEKIEDDTFEYILAVEQIWLWRNKIKKLNGIAFVSLHKLTKVYLDGNDCIYEIFDGATRIAELPRVVTEKCGFTESEPSPAKNVTSEADLMAPSEELQSSSAKISGVGGTWLICLGFLRLAKNISL